MPQVVAVFIRSLVLAALSIAATSSPAVADICHDAAARIASVAPPLVFETRQEPDEQEPVTTVRFRHKLNGSVSVFCTDAGDLYLSIETAMVPPSAALVERAASLGAVTLQLQRGVIRRAVRRCIAQAGKSGGATSSVSVKGAVVHCTFDDVEGAATSRIDISQLRSSSF